MTPAELFGGRFAIERLASAGGMAEVYRALDRATGARVALKVLHAAGAPFAGHFARESYVLAELDHPGIVRYVAHGAAPSGELFLAMEWLEGEDLAQRLKRGPLSIAETLTLGVRVAEALGAAHARGVVHRDIKPSNLFLPDRDIGRVKILDFGIARPQATRPATRTGILLGTPGYMAPEQALGARTVDPRADVFALGCVLYECLVGRPAFEAEHLMVLLSKMLAPEPPRPADVRPDTPAALDEIIARMLSHEPAHRPADGAAVAVEIAMLDDAETAWVQGGVPFHRLGAATPIEDLFEVTGVGLPDDVPTLNTSPRPDGGASTLPLDAWYRQSVSASAPQTQVLPGAALALAGSEDDTTLVPHTLLGRPSPCVGREREIDEVLRAFGAVVSTGKPSALVVTGEPGVGKSRLVAEVVRALDQRGGLLDAEGIVRPVSVFTAEAAPLAQGAAFALAADLVRNAAGLSRADSLSARRDKLLERLARHLSPASAGRVVEFLGELTDVPFPDDTSVPLRAARQDARLMGDHVRRAFEDWLAAECDARPVLVVLEDLARADAASIGLFEGALSSLASRPFFLLVTDAPPSFAAGRARALPLPALLSDAAQAIVRHGLGEAAEPALVTRIVQRGLGSPLRLEILTRAVRAGEDVPSGPTPELVGRAIASLSPLAQRLLRAASVFGARFWPGALFSVLPGGASARTGTEPWQAERKALAELLAAELVVRRAGRTPWGEEHAFRHVIVREVAYASLDAVERARLHLAVGAWFERAGDTEPAVLAEHFSLAGASDRAVPWAGLAAEAAFEASDFDAVLAWVARGIAAASAGEVRGALRLFESQARKWKGEHRAALEAGHDALGLFPIGSPLWYSAAGEVVLAAGNLGDDAALVAIFEALSALGAEGESGGPHVIAVARAALQLLMAGHHDHAEAMFRALDMLDRRVVAVDPEVAASVHRARAFRALFAGDAGTSVREFEAAAVRFEAVGDLRNACVQRANVGSATNELGDYARAEASLRDALAQAERLGLGALVAHAKLNLALALARQGQLPEAHAFAREALTTSTRQGDRRVEGYARLYLGMIRLAGRDLAAAEAEVRAAIDLLAAHPPVRAHALAVLGQIAIFRGDARAALGPADEAMRLLESLGGIEEGESLVRLVRAEALASLGLEAEAREAIVSAYERLEGRAAKIRDPLWRAWFLEAVPENARTVELARAWGVAESASQDDDTSA
ncbi:serine/threonine-protein kinase [Polyangium jinanense]|uniref:AAA family ATPase n=1 Tax=Polyangium jinanense TaxID=2829994 RepID=A0A9X4ATA8_9BACT|nr:serine/threonine-protein kinase [Polyangium jinanense]MDC3954032.1 AAA family ATPase [Polyangium jinanense]MDC3982012.1 AAA family ATPase [Polyangium jinanense]